MINKLTYGKVNKYLLYIGKNLEEIDDIYIKYLLRNEYIERIENNTNRLEINMGINNYKLTNKGEIFIEDYKNIPRKIEYFFTDYSFLGSLTIGFLGGILSYIFIELIKKL